jgi:hypothetical protein
LSNLQLKKVKGMPQRVDQVEVEVVDRNSN